MINKSTKQNAKQKKTQRADDGCYDHLFAGVYRECSASVSLTCMQEYTSSMIVLRTWGHDHELLYY